MFLSLEAERLPLATSQAQVAPHKRRKESSVCRQRMVERNKNNAAGFMMFHLHLITGEIMDD
jgi:hypothetical protein